MLQDGLFCRPGRPVERGGGALGAEVVASHEHPFRPGDHLPGVQSLQDALAQLRIGGVGAAVDEDSGSLRREQRRQFLLARSERPVGGGVDVERAHRPLGGHEWCREDAGNAFFDGARGTNAGQRSSSANDSLWNQ